MLTDHDKTVRRRRITGTRIGAIVGLSHYRTPIDVWRELVHDDADDVDEESEDILRGRFLEPALLAWYAHRTGAKVEPQCALIHPRDPRFAATPDGVATLPDGRRVNLEVKAPRRGDDWGDDGTDEIPAYHVCQVALEMACADLDTTHVISHVYGGLRIYEIDRNLDLESALLSRGRDFWDRYVVPRTPPPVDSTESYKRYLESRFPASIGATLLTASAEHDALARAYLDAKARLAEAEAAKDAAANKLREAIGDAGGISGDGWRCKWSAVQGRRSIDWRAYALALGGNDDEAKRYETRGAGYRRFDLREAKR